MNRRDFLRRSAGVLAAASPIRRAWAGQAPAIVTREGVRPGVPSGVASGDVTDGRAIVWSRTDRPSRMIVEYSTTPSFKGARRAVSPAVTKDSDFTARVDLSELPAGQRISYRVTFQDLSDLKTMSVPVAGTFQTPDRSRSRDVVFAYSGDTVGQGWGIDLARGGMRLYDTMHQTAPDVFVHLGDSIYADNPLTPTVKLDDGSIWRNVMTEAKAAVAQELADFRGNQAYNRLDAHVRRFNSDVSQIALWDDHEVRNNWYPTQTLEADPRYRVKSVATLAARAKQAFIEYHPLRINATEPGRIYRSWRHGPSLEIFALDMRTYRGPNSRNRQTVLGAESAFMGAAQVEWLKKALAVSTSAWKVIAADMPLGLVVPDDGGTFEAVANGDDGPPSGRELEIAGLLKFIRDRRVKNVVWITADVHYAAAHHYDPAGAAFTDFDPFWEFVGGPLHAGTFGPNVLDKTFGPEVRFIGIPPGMPANRPPSDGFQFFGTGTIDRRTQALTMRLHNAKGEIFKIELPAAT